jgi:hypothetical protein
MAFRPGVDILVRIVFHHDPTDDRFSRLRRTGCDRCKMEISAERRS